MIEKNESALSRSVLTLAILICFSAIIILTGFLLFFKKPSPVAVQPTVNPKTTTMPDIDIADWKTYKNEEYGFEVKYPKDFEGQEPESGDALSDVLLGAEKTEGGNSYYFTIKIRPNYKVDQITSGVKDAEKITVGDRPGYKYFYTEGIGESGVALIQIGQDELSIIFDLIGDSRQDFATANDRKIYVQNMLDQILSTFKFTEKDKTADWKVYRNEEYGFEFKYPKDWFIRSESIMYVSIVNNRYKDAEGEFPYLNISIINNEKNLTLRDWFFENIKPKEGEDYELKNVMVKDYNAIEFSYSRIIKNTLIDFNSNIVSFRAINAIENYDQILSTFKFIKKDKTADWKVYRNEEYWFEFKYKSDWQLEQQDNYIELKPIINDKPEEISISVNIITNRPKDYTLAGWLLQNGNNNASCDFVKKVDKIEWCGVNSERFEAVRADDYGVTKNGIDYDIQFRVAYGRQEMDKYISDKELSGEIDVLNQILSTFKFIEKDETVGWNVYRNEEYGYEVKYPKDWVYKEYNNAIYFGTPESKSGGYIWGISVQQPNELEKLISQTGNQFDDRKEIREKAMIDKNISGILITVTTNKHDDWISKKIYFEKNGKLFVIENGSIVDDRFKAFYNSFEFVNE